MRIIYLLLPLLLLGACKTQKMSDSSSSQKHTSLKKPGACPEDGTCNVVVHRNSTLSVETDDTGATYPEINSGKNIVVEFTFSRKAPEGVADGNYSETIHFEIPENTKTLSLQDGGLSTVNMLWGKHCFCPDAGYSVVNKGSLKVNKTGNELTFDVKVNSGVKGQKVNHIIRTVKI